MNIKGSLLHAELEEVEIGNGEDYYDTAYEVVLLVGSFEVLRLPTSVAPSYKHYDSDKEEIIADTLGEYFRANMSSMP